MKAVDFSFLISGTMKDEQRSTYPVTIYKSIRRQSLEKVRNDGEAKYLSRQHPVVSMAIQVVEFSNGGYKIRKIIA